MTTSPGTRQETAAPAPRTSRLFMPFYLLAFAGLMATTATPVAVTLALRAQQLYGEEKTAVLATTLAIGTVFASVAQPLGGWLSDRTVSRWGRRRPWLVLGLLGGVVGLLVIALVPERWGMVLGWSIASLFLNLAFSALFAVLADQVPPDRRGRVSGWIGVALQAGLSAGTWGAVWLGNQPVALFLGPAAFAVLTTAALLVVLPDRSAGPGTRAPAGGVPWRERLAQLARYRDFGFVWAGRFLLLTGYYIFFNFQLYTLTDHLGVTVAVATSVVALNSTLSAVLKLVVAPLAGWLSDRLGRRRVLVGCSAALFAVSMLLIALAQDVTTFVLGASVGFVAYGVFLAVDLALATEVLPEGDAHGGFGLGLYNVAGTVSQSLAPVVAVSVLAASGDSYPLLYTVAAGLVAAAVVTVMFVRSVR
ncbi:MULTISPECIES: MFS transporter [unclassified Pseudonocardia]|uniref:MFS transporter n=1 Tax=unclassified Pseudonocardia TaxID=2619320 RepID=UPI001CF697E5|nr:MULTISPECIES: MFS transporter [unclassified Pseudonocardia]